jgi:hypothetical protein
MEESVRRVMRLAPETRLLPGHCDASILAEERHRNPYVQQILADAKG